ncbi:MAG: spheroidene monooxygenase [Pseudomonadota bacterium]
MAIQTVTLSFFRFDRLSARLWAFAMMGLARPAMARLPEVQFWKLFGSGVGEGFTPRPNWGVYAVMAVWPDEDLARKGLRTPIFNLYRNRASEHWTIFLNPASVRGAWSGTLPFAETTDLPGGPLAALTRATVKPRKMMRFWGRAPAISDAIGNDPNVAFKIGIGEVPWLQQVTFSIWPDTSAMAAFARDQNGPHAKAIRAVREGGWFREELYARFRIAGDIGTWGGTSPLSRLERTRP